MLHAIGSLSPSIMYASTGVILLPLTDVCASMGTHYDAGVNKGHPSRCCVRNTKKSNIDQRI